MIIEKIESSSNSEEINDIITAVPKWIVRWGISLIFLIFAGIIGMSALISYPEIVKTSLRVNSLNSPKSVIARQSGKLTQILIKNNQVVKKGQSLAYLESIASPEDVQQIHELIKAMQKELLITQNDLTVTLPTNLNLGEIQFAYQELFQEYIQFKNTLKDGYFLKRREFLRKDLSNVDSSKQKILEQKKVQQLEYSNQEAEYNSYKSLFKKGVISRSEFLAQENKYLAAKHPLQQNESSLINNKTVYNEKQKELLELENMINQQKLKFSQSLNKFYNETETWMLKYVLTAPVDGIANFAGIIQLNQNVNVNQEIFIINPGNTDFFGDVNISQYNMGKIRVGEKVNIKMLSYPFEQYGMIRGSLSYLSDVAYRDSIFVGRVKFEKFENLDPNHKIVLKNGMLAQAEIITEESTLLQKFFRNITKILNSQ
jgi:multidrug efflux pump subunit AcrA (membrane-fusion protein)